MIYEIDQGMIIFIKIKVMIVVWSRCPTLIKVVFKLNLLFNWDCSSLALFIDQFLIKFNNKKFWNSGRNPDVSCRIRPDSGRIPGQNQFSGSEIFDEWDFWSNDRAHDKNLKIYLQK